MADRVASLEDAILLAAQAHRGQRDKAGAPYILHPLRMMLRLRSPHAMMAAVLHDVVEDTPWTLDQLRQAGYPPAVVAAVECLTARADESYEAFIERVQGNPIARQVKIADLEDNMDIRRLPVIGERDAARLSKYRRAWEWLTAEEEPA